MTIVALCLVFAVYNIVSYLILRKVNKALITAFYVALCLGCIATLVQWSCQMADPRFYAIMFLIQSKDDSEKMDIRLYTTFAIACVVSNVFNYALNWIIIATIQDLSMTVCLLTETLQADEYLRKRKVWLLISSLAALLYGVGFIVIPTCFHD